MNPEWIGYTAALMTVTSYVPQAVKSLRKRHTADISLWMYVLVSCGSIFWLIYGLMVGSPSIILTNATALVLALAILLMKLRYG